MLHRRQFLTTGLITALGCACSPLFTLAQAASPRRNLYTAPLEQEAEPDLAATFTSTTQQPAFSDDIPMEVRDYLTKMRQFDSPFPQDIFVSEQERLLLTSVMDRFNRLQNHIGHGHFYLISMDEAIRYAKRPSIGNFSRQELTFLESLFHVDASGYGFLDQKPLTSFTAQINKPRVVKVSGMGNYVYKGAPLETWNDIQNLLGDEVVLTSGIRGVVKQFHLFLAKAQKNDGNLSLASRSLAPPGYSFHGVGDFDVGQRGFGINNFTDAFTTTPVYRTLSERGYITLRYPQDNLLGVRFEPWHVKVHA